MASLGKSQARWGPDPKDGTAGFSVFLTQKKWMLRCCGERKGDPIKEIFDSRREEA